MFALSIGLARILKKKIAMEIYDFLKTVDERNRASEMALRHAASILEDFRELSEEGRKVMVDTLMELISRERENQRIKRPIRKEGKHEDSKHQWHKSENM